MAMVSVVVKGERGESHQQAIETHWWWWWWVLWSKEKVVGCVRVERLDKPTNKSLGLIGGGGGGDG